MERSESEIQRISALSWKTTCTGNVVANGRKWTVVEEEYGEEKKQREQEAVRQMDGDSDERQWKKGKEETEKGKGERKENEKGDTFITRRRATGKIERQVVFACGSLPGPRGECER